MAPLKSIFKAVTIWLPFFIFKGMVIVNDGGAYGM